MGVEKVLVTGGLGFIGSHTVVELLNEGFVVVVDNLANSTIDKIDKIKTITGKEFEFYEVDVTDEVKTEKVFANSKISSVIHFAGTNLLVNRLNNLWCIIKTIWLARLLLVNFA